jgi:hypothetical protein
VSHFDAPAHRLVVSDLGTRALALGGRGEVVRVSRLDLDARTTRPLRDLRIDGAADSYDGATWAVCSGREVLLLDTLHPTLRTLWHVAELPGRPLALERPDPAALAFITRGEGGFEGWFYRGGTLRQRAPLRLEGQEPTVVGACTVDLAPDGIWHAVVFGSDGPPRLGQVTGHGSAGQQLEGAVGVRQLAGGQGVAAVLLVDGGAEVRWWSSALAPLGAIGLEGSAEVALRVAGGTLTVADELGRVMVVALRTGRCTHDLRA